MSAATAHTDDFRAAAHWRNCERWRLPSCCRAVGGGVGDGGTMRAARAAAAAASLSLWVAATKLPRGVAAAVPPPREATAMPRGDTAVAAGVPPVAVLPGKCLRGDSCACPVRVHSGASRRGQGGRRAGKNAGWLALLGSPSSARWCSSLTKTVDATACRRGGYPGRPRGRSRGVILAAETVVGQRVDAYREIEEQEERLG